MTPPRTSQLRHWGRAKSIQKRIGCLRSQTRRMPVAASMANDTDGATQRTSGLDHETAPARASISATR